MFELLSNSASSLFFSLFPPLLIIVFLFKWLSTTTTTTKRLPPSPPKLLVIGNFHQLGPLSHRALWSLAKRYGPLMHLHFGKVPILVVSSADAAREIMKTQDISFANKFELRNLKLLLYGMKDVVSSPYGEYWRQMKKIFVLNLLSKKRVRALRSVRVEETALLMRKITESCSKSLPVDLRDLFVTLINDVECRSAFGRKYSEGKNWEKLKHTLGEFAPLLGAFTFRDYIPMLGWLDRVRGMDGRVKRVAKDIDEFLEGVIEERKALLEKETDQQVNRDGDRENFVDIILKIQQDDNLGIPLSNDSIKALILDAYAGGSDTISVILEWEMAELIRNPNSMKQLQNEIREVLNGKLIIDEEDLEKMEYLKAVIKETFRIHPPATLHARTTRQDTKLMGYDIEKGTNILINSWAIANDPKLWDDPHVFRPERFLNSSIDFKGHHFEFIPFGAGKRQCPGISFTMAINEYVLANLAYKFNWGLPGAARPEDMDMTEAPGAVICRKYPLLAMANPSSY